MSQPQIHVLHLGAIADGRSALARAVVDRCRRLIGADETARLRVSLGLLRPRRVRLDELAGAAREAGIGCHEVACLGRFDPTLAVRLGLLIRRLGVDLVHAHDPRSHLLALVLQPLLDYRLVASAEPASDEPRAWRLSEKVRQNLLTGFDRVIAANHQLARQLCQIGCRPSQVAVIPSGVDTDTYSRHGVGDDLRRRLGVDAGARVVGVCADVCRGEALWTVCHAVRAAQAILGPMHLLAFGDEASSAEARRIGEECGFGRRIHTVAADDHSPTIYAALDVFVMVGPCQPAGDTALLEAQSMEVPVVCTAAPGVEDLVEDGATGLVARRADPQEIGLAIVELLSDRSRSAAIASAARLRICQRYSLADRLADVVSTYRRVMAQA